MISSRSRKPESRSSGSATTSRRCSRRSPTRAKITFPLLSDPGSKTIEDYHILNEAAKGKAEGVPNPGTFIVDKQGVIRAKIFLEGYRDRHTTDALIEAAKAVK